MASAAILSLVTAVAAILALDTPPSAISNIMLACTCAPNPLAASVLSTTTLIESSPL